MPQNEQTQIYLTKSLLTISQVFQSFDFTKKKKCLKENLVCVYTYIYDIF